MKICSRKPTIEESNVRFHLKGLEIEPAPSYLSQMVNVTISIPLVDIREMLETSKTYDEIYHRLQGMIRVVK